MGVFKMPFSSAAVGLLVVVQFSLVPHGTVKVRILRGFFLLPILIRSSIRRLVRAKRMVEASNPAEYEYTEGSIPIEWDAWIRGRRKEAPSVEELMKNEAYREQIKLKAREVEEKDLALRTKEYDEGLVAIPSRTVAAGHAAATSFGKQEPSKEPTSTANTFQPGSWRPNPKQEA
ncbi:NADH dehydrogenase [ubiquinone] 1 alpha subcomplex assembly factor 2 isoform 1-T1 [Syngnathus typhle]